MIPTFYGQHHRRVVLALAGALTLLVTACSHDTPQRTTVRFWHFWTEPSQRHVLDSLIGAYEALHPDVDVVPTELQWGDGKAKLQLAVNAGTEGDIVHIGLDWFDGFAGIFAALPDSLLAPSLHPLLGAVVRRQDTARAVPWTMNTRFLVRLANPAGARYPIGLCTSDPHNTLKRTLPLLWQYGAARFFRTLPVHATMDDSLVDALDALRLRVTNGALLERSRQLDEALLRGSVAQVVTGAWMLPDIERQRMTIVPIPSILNADLLAVSRRTNVRPQALAFVAWLTAPRQLAAFCTAVVDAGIPADTAVVTGRPIDIGYRKTLGMAIPLPTSAQQLRIEPIVEDMIDRTYRARSRDEIVRIVTSARDELRSFE